MPRPPSGRARARCCVMVAVAAQFILVMPSGAQLQRDAGVDWLVSANSEAELYLRALQLTAAGGTHQWSLRPFTPSDQEAILRGTAAHPWDRAITTRKAAARWSVIAPQAALVFNSGFPFGANDGAVWAGRGFTTSATFGARAEFGPLDLQLAPQVFRAENTSFPLAPNRQAGASVFANARRPLDIDLPKRFGDAAYQRIDPGQSSARISLLGLAGGISTANEFWGPAVNDPFLLGDNAAGFPHLFLGSARPLGFAGLAVHVRAIAGRLGQSDYSVVPMIGRRRYLSGLVGVVTLRQLPGLEVGGGRLFDNIFDDSTVSFRDVVGPVLHGFYKASRIRALGTAEGGEPDDQIASAFARWAFPGSGLEVYAEFGREDSNQDRRDLLEEPDHDAAVLLGFQKGWKPSRRRIVQLRAEIFNDRLSHLNAVRPQEPAYVHTPIAQGHTNLGQVLGAPDGFGGAGTLVSVDEYTDAGRTSIQYTRGARAQALFSERVSGDPPVDVLHAMKFERLTFHAHVDFVRSVTMAYELNRDFSGDAFNVSASASVRAHW